MHPPHVPMGDWKNEDDIKAELRNLTDELKQLREELRAMVAPRKPNPSRAFLHRQSWPPPRPSQERATAAEKSRPATLRRKRR